VSAYQRGLRVVFAQRVRRSIFASGSSSAVTGPAEEC
jgi:hypothetical protein